MLGIKSEARMDRNEDSWIGPAPWIKTELPGPIAQEMVQRDEVVSSPS